MDHAVMQALKRHLASVDAIDVSRFQFVNMEAVRTAAGTLWPQVRARVFLAARSIIDRRIAEDDLVIQCATGFLVIYKALSGEPAEQTTGRIREDMERFFLGERFADLLRVDATSESLTPAEFQAALAAAGVDDSEPLDAMGFDEPPRPAAIIDSLRFQPAWDVRKEAVASYFAVPHVREHEDGPELSGQALSGVLSRPEDRLAFDIEVLTRAGSALQTLLKAGVRCAVIAPAAYSALSSSRLRAGYISAMAGLSDEVRSLLWVRVTGAPHDAPAAVVAETGRTLLSYTHQLFFDVDLDAASLERAAQSEAPWLGARLPGPLTGAMRQDVERVLAQAARANRTVYLDGVDDWERLRFASRTAARLLTGGALGAHDAPLAPYRMTRNGLLARAA